MTFFSVSHKESWFSALPSEQMNQTRVFNRSKWNYFCPPSSDSHLGMNCIQSRSITITLECYPSFSAGVMLSLLFLSAWNHLAVEVWNGDVCAACWRSQTYWDIGPNLSLFSKGSFDCPVTLCFCLTVSRVFSVISLEHVHNNEWMETHLMSINAWRPFSGRHESVLWKRERETYILQGRRSLLLQDKHAISENNHKCFL